MDIDLSSTVFPANSVQWNLPSLVRKAQSQGLSDVPTETLQRCIQPVLDGLAQIDAETLLNLERATRGGTRLCDGVNVRPIHQQVEPLSEEGSVRYIHLSEIEDQYSMGIFIFPPYSKIPLHDHPGMCVISRVLYGDLQRLSLDLARSSDPWPDDHHNDNAAKRAFQNKVDHLVAPDCTVLYPFEGNLHEFVAGPTGAAVLDVLLPPYSGGRDCTFYEIKDVGWETNNTATHRPCYIIPTGQPEDFHCISGSYQDLGSA